MDSPAIALTRKRSQVRVLFRPLKYPYPWGFLLCVPTNNPNTPFLVVRFSDHSHRPTFPFYCLTVECYWISGDSTIF